MKKNDIRIWESKTSYFRIGIVGYSGQVEKVKKSRDFIVKTLEKEFTKFEKMFEGKKSIAVVSGYTNIGVPALAYEVGKRMNFHLVGIACSRSKEYECFDCDEVHLKGQEWGDESMLFLKSVDIIIRLGGGKQTREEVAMAKEKGIEVIEYDL